MGMKTILAAELRCSSAGTVLIQPVTHIMLCYATSLLMVAMIIENQKRGLTEAMVHPPEDVAAVVLVADKVVVVIKTLDKVTTNMTSPSRHHHAQIAAAKISGFIIFRRVLETLYKFLILIPQA